MAVLADEGQLGHGRIALPSAPEWLTRASVGQHAVCTARSRPDDSSEGKLEMLGGVLYGDPATRDAMAAALLCNVGLADIVRMAPLHLWRQASTMPVGRRSADPVSGRRRKMLNLDGSRANSARHEPELFIRLQEPGRFEPLYRRVMKATRVEGFGEAQVPDFLGAPDGDEQLLPPWSRLTRGASWPAASSSWPCRPRSYVEKNLEWRSEQARADRIEFLAGMGRTGADRRLAPAMHQSGASGPSAKPRHRHDRHLKRAFLLLALVQVR